MSRNYWLDLFTGETWKEYREKGGEISGFRESRWTTVQKIKVGDYLLCYMTRLSRWVGILEVLDKPFFSAEPKIWSGEDFPSRMKVKPIIELNPEHGVPVKDLKEKLSYFQNMTSSNTWTGHFRGSPVKEKKEDAEIIINALEQAKSNPIIRPVDPRKLARKPRTYSTKNGLVTIPEETREEFNIKEDIVTEVKSVTHEEIQWLLLKIGDDLGLDLWVARNDKNKEFNGKKLSDFGNILTELPVSFDPATNKTIELIDVLWLKGNAILAAFEIEHTTSIYSGILRMSDLISMQPNLNINLYIVAPDDRREKVLEEVNRPVFSKLPKPLNEICQYLSYSVLKEFVDKLGGITKHLKPSFIDDLAEPCNENIE